MSVRSRIFDILGIVLILISSVTFTSCSTNGYHSITVKNEIAHFSFEYPDYYSDREGPTVQNDKIHQYTYVNFFAPKKAITVMNPNPFDNSSKTVTTKYAPAYIDIFVYDARDRGGTAISDLENKLKSPAYRDVKILDRSSIKVNGITGEQVSYMDTAIIDFQPIPGEEIPAKYVRMVYFDYGNLVWNFEVGSEASMDEQVKADFEHVLSTFKILD
jgi:hypothetical protein